MTKYDELKNWRKIRSRGFYNCYLCGTEINKGDFYYRESMGLVRPSPGTVLRIQCADCHGVPSD